jgi:hypothetical protein
MKLTLARLSTGLENLAMVDPRQPTPTRSARNTVWGLLQVPRCMRPDYDQATLLTDLALHLLKKEPWKD